MGSARTSWGLTALGPVPPALMVGIVPRPAVEDLLRRRVPDHLWREEAWQPQAVLPVVVSTRDGHRFGFFPIGIARAADG